MTQAPSKPPIEDEDGEEKQESTNEFAYARQKPRNLIVVFSVVLLLALIVLGGIIMAVKSDSEDPGKIKFPEQISKSLADDQPANSASPVAVPYHATGEVTPLIDSSQPVQQSDMPQTESTLDLNPPTTTPAPVPTPAVVTPSTTPAAAPAVNGDEKTDEKKPEAGPQSMIQWDRIPVVTREQKIATNGHKPQIAIVIDDMGLNRKNSQEMASIKAAFTLSYLPYADNLPQQTSAARANGHELIVHMPMEPDNLKQNNPGPNALLTSNSNDENVRRLDKNLASFTGYIGINNHMGSRMTADASAMRPILQDLKQRGLWFLDSRTIGNSVAGKLASDMGVPYVARDVFLDNTASVSAVTQQLHELEKVAKKRGYAVAIGHPHDATIAALKAWIPQAQAAGYEFVSLSTVIAERYPSANVPQYAMLKKKSVPSEAEIEPAAGGNMTVAPFGLHASIENCVHFQ